MRTDDFYLPKTLYSNITHWAVQKHLSKAGVILECINLAIANNIKWEPGSVTIPDKLNNIPAVHFTPTFTPLELRRALDRYHLNNAHIIQAIEYGLNELERRDRYE